VCQRGLYAFNFARSHTAYTETVAGAIILLKYQHVTPLAGWFASSLRKTFDANSEACRADVVVPVPPTLSGLGSEVMTKRNLSHGRSHGLWDCLAVLSCCFATVLVPISCGLP
jgi:hypothetical protein